MTQSLKIRRVAGALGAEISGVDLSAELPDATIAAIRGALVEHQVIFFRDQEMDHQAHKDLGRKFGNLAIHSGVPGLPEHPEIVVTVRGVGYKAGPA